jgi:hypothetical protein
MSAAPRGTRSAPSTSNVFGPDEPVAGKVAGIVAGEVVGAVGGSVVGAGSCVVVVTGGGGGEFVMVNRQGPPFDGQVTKRLDALTGNATSTVLPGKPVSVTVRTLDALTRARVGARSSRSDPDSHT